MDRDERDGFAADGGVVAATSTTATPRGDIQQPSVGDEDHQEDSDPRTERARTEEMDVSLLRKGGVYEVQSASGNTYEVDVASKTCTCPDFTKRQPSGGCKHLRRVDIEIRRGSVPRPDGRLPARVGVAEQLAEAVHDLDREIEEREAKRRELQTAMQVLEEYSN
ncbi:hypothetical protein [Natrinema sp. CBA1119]|uniref:hypothetical protein n=1 Tax=Natrinema sp. CBA1119 TaxID=1608465 RepID=UPI00159BE192